MRQIALSFGLFFCLVQADAQETSSSPAVVVTAEKSWSANNKPLTRGTTIPLDAPLTQTGTQSMELVLDCGKAGWLSYTCQKVPCTVPACKIKAEGFTTLRVDLSSSNQSAPASSGGSWFSSLFKREPATLAVLGVREPGHITDAIVPESDSGIHLGPALNRVLEGKYCFRFTPLPARSSNAAKEATLDWDRSTDAEGAMKVSGLAPGLYTVEKSSSEAGGTCTFELEATPAWVLVANAAEFPVLDSQWKDFQSKMHEMERDGASPTVLLTVRHAALAHLADSAAGSK